MNFSDDRDSCMDSEKKLEEKYRSQLPDTSRMSTPERVMYEKIRAKFGNRFFTRREAWEVDRTLANAVGMNRPVAENKTGESILPFLEKWFHRARPGRGRDLKVMWMFPREKRLTWMEVEQMRRDAAANAIEFRELAEKYQVSVDRAKNIVLMKTWVPDRPRTGRPLGAKDLRPRKRRTMTFTQTVTAVKGGGW